MVERTQGAVWTKVEICGLLCRVGLRRPQSHFSAAPTFVYISQIQKVKKSKLH